VVEAGVCVGRVLAVGRVGVWGCLGHAVWRKVWGIMTGDWDWGSCCWVCFDVGSMLGLIWGSAVSLQPPVTTVTVPSEDICQKRIVQ
jgi:hypothetical protein